MVPKLRRPVIQISICFNLAGIRGKVYRLPTVKSSSRPKTYRSNAYVRVKD